MRCTAPQKCQKLKFINEDIKLDITFGLPINKHLELEGLKHPYQ